MTCIVYGFSLVMRVGFVDEYVVKTYPSIDPHSTPPPPHIYAYKCQINSIACCHVIT